MRKGILTISMFLIYLGVPSVLIIAQNNDQKEKLSEIGNPTTESETRIERKKKELKEKNVDVNSITPSQIEELLDSKILTIDDVENIFPEEKLMKLRVSTLAKSDKDNQMALLMPAMIGEALYELRYYVGEVPSGEITPKLKEAIKDFQQSLHNDPTGELLFGEFKELMDRYSKLHPHNLNLPGYNFSVIEEWGYVKIQGTWVFKDGTPHHIPIQTSIIDLDKNTMSGIEALATVSELFDGTPSLDVEIIRWKITKWDKEEIVAENNAPLNASYTLTVDVKNKKVHLFRRHKGEKIFGKVELEPAILELVDGFKVSYELQQERQKEAFKFYNPKHRNVLEQLTQAAK